MLSQFLTNVSQFWVKTLRKKIKNTLKDSHSNFINDFQRVVSLRFSTVILLRISSHFLLKSLKKMKSNQLISFRIDAHSWAEMITWFPPSTRIRKKLHLSWENNFDVIIFLYYHGFYWWFPQKTVTSCWK